MRETFVDILLRKSGAGHTPKLNHRLSHIRLLQKALTQPVRLLLFEPSILLLNIAVAFSFAASDKIPSRVSRNLRLLARRRRPELPRHGCGDARCCHHRQHNQ